MVEVGESRRYPWGDPMTQVLGYVAAVSESEQTGDPLLQLPDFRIGILMRHVRLWLPLAVALGFLATKLPGGTSIDTCGSRSSPSTLSPTCCGVVGYTDAHWSTASGVPFVRR